MELGTTDLPENVDQLVFSNTCVKFLRYEVQTDFLSFFFLAETCDLSKMRTVLQTISWNVGDKLTGMNKKANFVKHRVMPFLSGFFFKLLI